MEAVLPVRLTPPGAPAAAPRGLPDGYRGQGGDDQREPELQGPAGRGPELPPPPQQQGGARL